NADGAIEGLRKETPWEGGDREVEGEGTSRMSRSPEGRECVAKMQAPSGASSAEEDLGEDTGGDVGGKISVVGRTREQVETACAWGGERDGVLDVVYADLADVEEWAEAMEGARRMGCRAGLATPRMVLPGQEWVWERVVAARPDAVRVRSLGALRYLRARLPEAELVADFSLNAVNDLSAGVLARWGAGAIVAGFDAEDAQLAAMMEYVRAARIEARLYGRTPLFYTRYCLYAATVGGGADCSRCPRPCRKQDVRLRDRRGQELPVMADALGGNSVYAEARGRSAAVLRGTHARRDAGDARGARWGQGGVESAEMKGRGDGKGYWRRSPEIDRNPQGRGRVVKMQAGTRVGGEGSRWERGPEGTGRVVKMHAGTKVVGEGSRWGRRSQGGESRRARGCGPVSSARRAR
ncbi:MAG: U32 family peptidase, partial [Planctomycetota bacterium]|nr:U32 family peptidase [Planctomycetota bacterium]